jgi:Secretion system C-terminal sorting domain
LPVLPNTLTHLDCERNSLTALPTLPTSLLYLSYQSNYVGNLPLLPPNLTYLNLRGNVATNLPTLPSSLTLLDCSSNQISVLPTLPNGLKVFVPGSNPLTSLPLLPNTITVLYCGYSPIQTLPTLPDSLIYLECVANGLTSLPPLPSGLLTLNCGGNAIRTLPTLPNLLRELKCVGNLLTTLPNFPNRLSQLDCSYNLLTALPELNNVEYLTCEHNRLTDLPELNHMNHLICNDNPIVCLPFLPNTLSYLNTTNTQITCLPNRRPFGNLTLTPNRPLCTPNNLNGCLSAARIYGKAYTDTDNTCTVTNTDNLQQNLLVKAVNTTTQQVFVGTSDANGLYEIAVPIGDYTVSVVPPSGYWSVCGGVQTIVITQDGQQEQRDVLVKPIVQCADMEIDHQLQNIARPCSTAVYKIAYFNSGTIPSAGAFAKITLPAALTLASMTRPYTSLGGGVFEVQLPSVAALARDTFSLSANVSCSAAINQMLCTEVEILPHTFCNAGLSGWDGSDIELTGRCVGQDSVRFIITNTGGSPMSGSRPFWVIEDNVMIRGSVFQLAAGASDSITVAADPQKIYRMIADEAPNNPSGNTQETFLVWGCHGINPQIHWGFVNQFGLNNGSQNPHSLCTPVRTSFDPNDIAATPEGTGTQHFILKNTDLEYKIRFQNTGNDTAFVVRVLDKIPAELDLTTLRIGSASHPMTYSLKANGTLEFLFQNIRLEDSTSNEAKSHGFVTYKIKTKPNIVTGSIINNQAFIYFDANTPVATNIYTHTIGENLTTIFISTIEVVGNTEFSVKIMPNPMHDVAVFEIGDSQSPRDIQLTLYNTLGQAVKTQRFIDGKLVLERDNLPQGCYFYKITSDGKMMAQGRVVCN